ncbi:MAG TPA: FlgD immunoglobulin-like domain containing protein, partial [Candidatus Eisenbacteria bacterium]|nr:FlgD immunoglobulin-like domain containing protein [Candidatus Eisenbacteria bacterium]
GKFRGTLVHTVKSTGGAFAASISPNPLNPETTLSFQIRTPGRVTVKVFDLNGRLVKTLLDDSRGAGFQDLTWNGTSENGGKVASGIYYFRLETPDGRAVMKATVLK